MVILPADSGGEELVVGNAETPVGTLGDEKFHEEYASTVSALSPLSGLGHSVESPCDRKKK